MLQFTNFVLKKMLSDIKILAQVSCHMEELVSMFQLTYTFWNGLT